MNSERTKKIILKTAIIMMIFGIKIQLKWMVNGYLK